MPRYIYGPGKNGLPEAHLVSDKTPLEGTPVEVTKGFHEIILNAYKTVEAEGGRWQGSYPKEMVKRIHEQGMERGE